MRNVVFNVDNMEGMSRYPDKYFDIGFIDPEYGRGESGGINRSGYVMQANGTKIFVNGSKYAKKDWDKEPASPSFFREAIRVTKHQIIWGVNYFDFYFGPGRIVWDKCNDGSSQSNCELAYNSLTTRVDIVRYMWRGMMQGSAANGQIMEGNKKLNEVRIHPTQKPVYLYKWQLTKFCQPGWKILSTNVGSGSDRIAAYDYGFDFVGFELDKDYFLDQQKRYINHISQQKLF